MQQKPENLSPLQQLCNCCADAWTSYKYAHEVVVKKFVDKLDIVDSFLPPLCAWFLIQPAIAVRWGAGWPPEALQEVLQDLLLRLRLCHTSPQRPKKLEPTRRRLHYLRRCCQLVRSSLFSKFRASQPLLPIGTAHQGYTSKVLSPTLFFFY